MSVRQRGDTVRKYVSFVVVRSESGFLLADSEDSMAEARDGRLIDAVAIEPEEYCFV